MPAPYGNELLQKAIDAVACGKRFTQVCRMFNISRNTQLGHRTSRISMIAGW